MGKEYNVVDKSELLKIYISDAWKSMSQEDRRITHKAIQEELKKK